MMTSRGVQEIRQFQLDEMRDTARQVREQIHECTHAVKVSDFTGITWTLRLTYILADRLAECFYDHATRVLDRTEVRLWRRELYRVAKLQLRALEKAHNMEWTDLVYGTEDWTWQTGSIVHELDRAARELERLSDRWEQKYITSGAEPEKS
jgi:hypothetical protein